MGIPTTVNPNEKQHHLYENIEYRNFWQGTARFSLDKHEHSVLKNWLPSNGRRIIDVGCGYGRLTDCYLDKYKQVVLFDSSLSLLTQAYEKYGGKAWFVAGDVNQMPFRRGSFDHILMVRVLHHISDLQACLRELQRVVCGGGKVTFTYSNKRNVARMAGYLMRRDPLNPFSEETISLGPTLIRHHPRYIERVLMEMGYTNLDYRGVGVFDKIAGKLGDAKILDAAGSGLAAFLGDTKLAPWVFCQYDTPNKDAFVETDNLIDILQCPMCQGELVEVENGYRCKDCTEFYPLVDGMIDLRPK